MASGVLVGRSPGTPVRWAAVAPGSLGADAVIFKFAPFRSSAGTRRVRALPPRKPDEKLELADREHEGAARGQHHPIVGPDLELTGPIYLVGDCHRHVRGGLRGRPRRVVIGR